MIIVILGESGSGKSTIQGFLEGHFGYETIVSLTTRKQRIGEQNGKDYHFVDDDTFKETIWRGLLAEYDEYSQGRFYGTLKSDYQKGNKVVVLTPNGLRQLKRSCPNDDIFVVYVTANLGTRVKRYIDRCGVDKFNFDDKNEIAARVERDFAMFLGIDKEADLVVYNNEGTDVFSLAEKIHKQCQDIIEHEVYAYTE